MDANMCNWIDARNSLNSILEDRLIFRNVLFTNIGIMIATLPEIICNVPFVKSIQYDGSVNAYTMQLDPSLVQDDLYSTCEAIICTALQHIMLMGCTIDELVVEKQKQSYMKYTEAYNHIVGYVEDPKRLSCFFKVLDHGSGFFIIKFN